MPALCHLQIRASEFDTKSHRANATDLRVLLANNHLSLPT
jgi:hypothetical protein